MAKAPAKTKDKPAAETAVVETPAAEPEKSRAVAKAPIISGGTAMAIIPQSFEDAYRIATAIVRAKMAPNSYKESIDAVTVGILHGLEVGFTPMAALQSIAVINGMPAIWGDGALALVQASGLCEDHEEALIHGDDGELIGAMCMFKRKGRKTPVTQRFDKAMATKAGLINKQGPWTQYPERMYKMRARSWAMRDAFADVLRGLRIREEVEDMGELVEGADGVRRAAPPKPQPADYVEPADAVAPEISTAQAKAETPAETSEVVDGATGEVVESETVEEPAAATPVAAQDEPEEVSGTDPYPVINEHGDEIEQLDSPAVFVSTMNHHIKRLADPVAFYAFQEFNEDAVARLKDENAEQAKIIEGWYRWRNDQITKAAEDAAVQASKKRAEDAAEAATVDARIAAADAPAAEPEQQQQDGDPLAAYRLRVYPKARGTGPDWQRFRSDVLALISKHDRSAIPAIREANSDIFATMLKEGKTWHDALDNKLRGLEADG